MRQNQNPQHRGFSPFFCSFISSGPGHDRRPGCAWLHRLFLWGQLPKKPAAKKESSAPELPGSPSGPRLAARGARQARLRPGESGMPTHSQHSAKVAEIVATAARISRAIDPGARRSAAGIFVRAWRPAFSRQIFPGVSLPSGSRHDRLGQPRCSERFGSFELWSGG